MDKKSLKEFNLDELKKIMLEFSKKPRIFNSEAQFQFELAWRINELFDCDVLLEEISRIYHSEKELKSGEIKKYLKKDYTDIILKKDDLCIAIELKYKTAILQLEQLTLSHHGAVDLGAYDFMWDINRLQMLTGKSEDETVYQIRCDRGYAVILTNDKNYWKSNENNKKRIHREFVFCGDKDGKGCLKQGEHSWFDKDGKRGNYPDAVKGFRRNPINLRKDYQYQWTPYPPLPGENGEFKFMIVKVD